MKDSISSLYELYGFSKDIDEKYYTVYLYDQGYFNNAEIIKYKGADEDSIQALKEDYLKSGYSVSIKEGTSKESVEKELFSGFFKVENSNNRVISEYEDFCKMQTKKNGGLQYSYIPSLFTINGNSSSEPIIDLIYKLLSAEGSQLIILEAPAAFGKTCTSYEVSKEIAIREQDRVPILAELSKNRTASIFDYVLYSEIDKKFTQLSSKLVTEQIIKGRIPLLIDGFDELLSKSHNDQADSIEDVKSMLDTIANLFKRGSNAKVLLTSRKSAIFVGEVFDEWANQKLEECTITRVQILSPSVKDWISQDKLDILHKSDIDLIPLANPALLSVLKNSDIDLFQKEFRTTSDILEYYIEMILHREIERQQLLVEASEQRTILQKLASMMVQLDIVSDEPEGIKALIEDIISPHLYDYLKRYNDRSDILEPNEEEFVMKIVHNAFLDRVKISSNDIGFINEFIFGIFIGEAIVNNYVEILDVKGKFLSFVISAFSVERPDRKDRLIDELAKIEKSLSTEQKLLIETSLTRSLSFDYVDEYISDMTFDGTINYSTGHYFYNCIFTGCIFKDVTFEDALFEGCYFINCSFYNVDAVKTETGVSEVSSFVSCSGHEKLLAVLGEIDTIVVETNEKNDTYYERILLEQFWMPGAERIQLKRSYTTLFRGIPPKDRSKIDKAVERLCNRGIFRKQSYCIAIDKSKLQEVSTILGR